MVFVPHAYHVCILSALLSPVSSYQILAWHIHLGVLPVFSSLCFTSVSPPPQPMPPAVFQLWFLPKRSSFFLFPLFHLSVHSSCQKSCRGLLRVLLSVCLRCMHRTTVSLIFLKYFLLDLLPRIPPLHLPSREYYTHHHPCLGLEFPLGGPALILPCPWITGKSGDPAVRPAAPCASL